MFMASQQEHIRRRLVLKLDQISHKPYLFVSCFETAADVETLCNQNIGLVINVSDLQHNTATIELYKKNNIKYIHRGIEDGVDKDIIKLVARPIYRKINKFRGQSLTSYNREKKGILVHCVAGISRSVTVLIYYLMRNSKWQLNYTDALEKIKLARPIACPYQGFAVRLQKECHMNQLRILNKSISDEDIDDDDKKMLPSIIKHH